MDRKEYQMQIEFKLTKDSGLEYEISCNPSNLDPQGRRLEPRRA